MEPSLANCFADSVFFVYGEVYSMLGSIDD